MPSSESELFTGTVSSVIYTNEDFRILKVLPDGGTTLFVMKGNFPSSSIDIGSWIACEAKWVDNDKFGRQLSVTKFPVTITTWTDERVSSALTSEGIGHNHKRQLKEWADRKGVSLQALLDSEDFEGSEKLIEPEIREYILSRWRSLRTYLDAAGYMAEVGLPPSVLSKIWKKFGSDVEKVLTKNPWELVRVSGVSFNDADSVARKMGADLNSPGRIVGAVLSTTMEIGADGHIFSTSGQIVEGVREKLANKDLQGAHIADAIKVLIQDRSLVLDKTISPGLKAVYDPAMHKIESECARLIQERLDSPVSGEILRGELARVCDATRDRIESDPGVTLETLAELALENWALGHKTTLTADQIQAARQAIISPISLLTGLPGTGKTTTLRAVVAVALDMGITPCLIAPTGIAAKRMSLVTNTEAYTVHRAFGAKGKSSDDEDGSYVGLSSSKKKSDSSLTDWEFGPHNFHPARMLIIDESSMLDLNMLHRVLMSTRSSCRILFVGDPYQLPSVGAGDVLRDLTRAKIFPHSHLTKIFRQENTSGIVLAAHDIHQGKTPSTSERKDFRLLEVATESEAAQTILKIAERLYDLRENFQVLSPRHAGDAGVTSLNQILRAKLNPASPGLVEIKIGPHFVREGDRIMVIKNDYTLGVFNGDVGKISKIDKKAMDIEIKIFEGPDDTPRFVRVPVKDAAKYIRLAYAQTVHKSQGQEYDTILFPILPSFGRQLQRNLFYTAITRAKKRVILVGSDYAVSKAVMNNQAESRNSLLAERICFRPATS